MIGIDTNVLVRYLTQDEPKQSALANRLLEDTLSDQQPGFVSTTTLIEIVWVLESGYECDRAGIAEVLEGLMRTKTLIVESPDTAWQAMRLFSTTSADFADCMIERAGAANGCEHTVTFDHAAAKATGMQLLL